MKYIFHLFIFLIAGIVKANAQQVIVPPRPNDSVRLIIIKQAKSIREKNIDSATVIKSAAGDAIIVEGKTTTYCDSAVYNQRTNILEAFGNIHINDADSIHTYAQYLRYIGLDRIAYLKKNVRLTDKKGTLYTDDLEYNLRTGIATYKNGGRVVNSKTVLTSKEGVYYADTKDIYFKNNVHLKDPKYNITTDSLRYNVKTGIANFITYTKIINKDGSVIITRNGTYDLNTGNAVFLDRTSFRDSNYFVIADKLAYEETTGILQMEGNAKLVDSINQVTVLGGLIFADKKKNTFLATNKSVMIFYRDNDSTYVTADTLFSGLRKYDTLQRKIITQKDTLKKVTAINTQSKDSSIRYFLAFHHVRIFNDSLQAVSDSLHYSTSDSTFKLFGTPIVWNGKTQVTGDTIYMYTQRQKPKRLYVFNNGLIINEAHKTLYNQIGGRTINAYFKEGQIDYVRVKGSPAESIFYPQDDDSAYTDMNRSSGDLIDIFFVNKELNKVKFVKDVNGVMYPLNQIPADKKQLKGFMWLDNRRPKNKLELFE